MQTLRDYIKGSIRKTLKSLGETTLLEDKIYKKFIKENSVQIRDLNRVVVREHHPIVVSENNKKILPVPIPTQKELKILTHLQSVTGVHIKDILSRSRKTEYVDARKMYMVILNIYLYVDLVETGRKVGRDHTTVIHAVKTHDSFMESEPAYRTKFGRLLELLKEEFPEDFIEVESTDFKKFNKQLNKEKWEKLIEYQKEKKRNYAKAY